MLEEISVFTKIIHKKFPDCKFAYGFGNVHLVMVYTEDEYCKRFCTNIHNWLGKKFRMEFKTEKEYEYIISRKKSKNNTFFNKITTIVSNITTFPTKFLLYSYNKLSNWYKNTVK